MGITIHYFGRLDSLDRIEDFEDRVIDLVLNLGGGVRLWRTSADEHPERVVRGLIVDLFPGQESTSLLFSPEGWLVDLFSIQEAEEGALAEPPMCSVKTQFGPVEGHVALVELLAALKKEFISNLEVQDEGGYWDSRNLISLIEKFRFLQAAIDGMAKGIRQFGLTPEAAEDPQILLTRLERIAHQVHKTISRPAEHAPVEFETNGSDNFSLETIGTESEWDAAYKENRRKQARIQRAIEEGIRRGETHAQAFNNALHDPGILNLPSEIGDPDYQSETESFGVDGRDEVKWIDEEENENGEDWRGGKVSDSETDSSNELTDPDDYRDWDPLLTCVSDQLSRLGKFEKDMPGQAATHFDTMMNGFGEMFGGLAQATGPEDCMAIGLRIVQLKRALRGAAFAQGSLFPLRATGVISKELFDDLHQELDSLNAAILAKLIDNRSRLERDSR